MDLTRFEHMEASELRQYLEFLLWHYRVVDGFWFLYTEEQRGRPEAEQLNERVWERVSGLAARDLVSRFGISEGGLEGFVKVLPLDHSVGLRDRGVSRRGRPHCPQLRYSRSSASPWSSRIRMLRNAQVGVCPARQRRRSSHPGVMRFRSPGRAAGPARLPVAVRLDR